jgi:hypothetical protein
LSKSLVVPVAPIVDTIHLFQSIIAMSVSRVQGGYNASTDLFLALALAMAFFTPCSAILSQSYGKSIRQFWLIFA